MPRSCYVISNECWDLNMSLKYGYPLLTLCPVNFNVLFEFKYMLFILDSPLVKWELPIVRPKLHRT